MPSRTPPPPGSANTTRRPFEKSGNDTGVDNPLPTRHDQAEGLLQVHDPPPAQSGLTQPQNVRFEHVSAGEDAQQVIVSTIRESVYGKDVAVQARGNQLLGQMEDRSVQRLSEDRAAVLLRRREELASGDNTILSRVYGVGHRLNEN